MFTNRNRRHGLFLCLAAIIAATLLQGCGGKSPKTPEEYLASMKEFSTPDKTASIYLDQEWNEEDLQMDCWLGAGNKKGDKAAILMQFPKSGANALADSMETVRELVESSYGVSELTDAEAPSIPDMSNVAAFTCKMTADGVTGGAYLVYGETDYAYYALSYVADKLNDSDIASFKASCSKFLENAPEVENNFSSEMTDTIRWFNASYAILTDLNNWDYNLFGGLPANDESKATIQQLLPEWWDVTDRATADETLDWILTEGHRVDFAENMQALEGAGVKPDTSVEDIASLLESDYGFDSEEAVSYASAYPIYTEHGENAIAGWDYCRAMNLLGYYYIAGYYSEQEALDKSLEVAQTMQSLFESWDDLIDSYLWGYEYWAGGDSAERRAISDDLKSRSDNPYQVDFKASLSKTW